MSTQQEKSFLSAPVAACSEARLAAGLTPLISRRSSLAGLQQIERGVDARLAAGQHDDGVGARHVARRGEFADMGGEDAEATGKQRHARHHHEGREPGDADHAMGAAPCERRLGLGPVILRLVVRVARHGVHG